MKKLCIVLILALLLSLGASAFAEGGVEIIVMDGIPVVMESFGLEVRDDGTLNAAGAGFMLPAGLVDIEDSAFEGVDAEHVEIRENVKSIGARAFADCKQLTEIVIPKTVESIDKTAFDGSENVTIYCWSDSTAYDFAIENNISHVVMDPPEEPTPASQNPLRAPVVMPYVAFN